MPLFDGSRFSSLFDPSFGSDGDVVADKKKNLSGIAEQKQKVLNFKSQLYNPDLLTDADTYGPLEDELRFGGRPGESLDAAENKMQKFAPEPGDDALTLAKKHQSLQRQRDALARIQGKHVSEISTEDVLAYGDLTTQKAKALLMEGYDPEKHGPQHNIEVADTGEKGYYGRRIVEVRNPYTGKNLLDALNNPTDNLGYYSDFNAGRVEKDLQLAKDTKTLEKTKNNKQSEIQPNQVFTQSELDNNDMKYLANNGLLSIDTLVGWGADITKFFGTNQLRKDVTSENYKTYHSRKSKEQIMLKIRDEIAATNDPEKKAKLIEGLDAVKLTAEEAALTDPVQELSFGRTRKNRPDGQGYESKYVAIEKALEEVETRATIQAFADKYKLGNSADIHEAGEVVGERYEKVEEGIKTAEELYKNGDTEAAANIMLGIFKEAGLAFSDVITEKPEAVLPLIFESLPYMMAAGTRVGFAVITNSFYQQGIDDFIKEHGQPPTFDEAVITFGTSITAALTETVGARLTGVTKLMKGRKAKPGKTDRPEVSSGGGRIKKDIPKVTHTRPKIDKALTAIDKAGSAVVRPVGRVLKGVAGETVTEATQTALEEYGAKQDLSKISGKQIFTGGVLGGIAGGGITSGVQAIDVAAKLVSKGAGKAADAIEKTDKTAEQNRAAILKKSEEAVAELNDQDSPNYNPVTSFAGTFSSLDTVEGDVREQRLQEVEAHAENILAQAIEVAETDEKQSLKLQEAYIEASDYIADFRKKESARAQKEASKTIETINRAEDERETSVTEVNLTPEDEQNIGNAVNYGSEQLTDLDKIANSSNVSPEVQDVAQTAIDADKALDALLEQSGEEKSTIQQAFRGSKQGLTAAQVKDQVLGAGTNQQGRMGLAGHVAGIKAALGVNNLDEAVTRIKKLVAFENSQRNKVAALREASKYDDKRKISYKTSPNTTGTVEARGQASATLANTVEAEANLMAAEIAAGKAQVALRKSVKAKQAAKEAEPTDAEALESATSKIAAGAKDGYKPDLTSQETRVFNAWKAKQDSKEAPKPKPPAPTTPEPTTKPVEETEVRKTVRAAIADGKTTPKEILAVLRKQLSPKAWDEFKEEVKTRKSAKGLKSYTLNDAVAEVIGVVTKDTTKTESIEPNITTEEEIIAEPAAEPTEQFATQEIAISELEGVPGNELRKNPTEMREFIAKIKSGEINPPIIVEMVDGKPVNIQEGNHTLAARKALGQTTVTIRIIEKSKPTGELDKLLSTQSEGTPEITPPTVSKEVESEEISIVQAYEEFNGKIYAHTEEIKGTDDTVTIKEDAGEYLRNLDERIDALENLKGCALK